ncbi:MAG: hypothetical protein ACI9F1_001141, partial [Colwellia sp.]
ARKLRQPIHSFIINNRGKDSVSVLTLKKILSNKK